jgi:hypothetical protein
LNRFEFRLASPGPRESLAAVIRIDDHSDEPGVLTPGTTPVAAEAAWIATIANQIPI